MAEEDLKLLILLFLLLSSGITYTVCAQARFTSAGKQTQGKHPAN